MLSLSISSCDVKREDSQGRFLATQRCSIVANGHNIAPALQRCRAKNRRCESSRVTSP